MSCSWTPAREWSIRLQNIRQEKQIVSTAFNGSITIRAIHVWIFFQSRPWLGERAPQSRLNVRSSSLDDRTRPSTSIGLCTRLDLGPIRAARLKAHPSGSKTSAPPRSTIAPIPIWRFAASHQPSPDRCVLLCESSFSAGLLDPRVCPDACARFEKRDRRKGCDEARGWDAY